MIQYIGRRWGVLAIFAAAFTLGSGVCVAAPEQEGARPSAEAAAAPSAWIRKVESNDGATVELQVAVREYVHADAARPRITVAGAVHIGEAEFYQQLHEVLDPLDVVLFEGVKPEDSAGGAEGDPKVELTRSRMRIVGLMADRFKVEKGRLPVSIEEMQEIWPDAAALKSPSDAWGGELLFLPSGGEEPGWEIVSLGADGAEGGEGAEADLRITSGEEPEEGEKPARAKKPRRPEGMQKQLADAMGVVFQLEVMDHSMKNWRNSDLSMEALQARFKEAGVEADGLMGMLSGQSMLARFSGVLLSMLSATEQSRAMLKVMMIEVLGEADRLFEQLPRGMGAMMTVIIDERNEVVLEDIERIIAEEPGVRTLGIIYGAGHLPHLEGRLTGDMGYEVAGERWLTAMAVDAGAAGIPPHQLEQMRKMIRSSMEAQTGRGRGQERKKRE